ncbi:MAG TPA: lipid-A-disaccharide synthase [Bacteroidales bacterium]|nr:lipid-A-disaccharide synthase [Bacteroidales bacterium]
MKYYIIAGEASGDLHASNLIKALSKHDPQAQFRAWGGDRMKEAGATLVEHYRNLSFMGFIEVLLNLRTIMMHIRRCKRDILDYKPDAVILVDYPGFNFRIATFANRRKFKVFYYISPQVWAWHKSRVLQVKLWVDRMFVILPFEKDFYSRFKVDVEFVGHPLADAIDNTISQDTTLVRQNLGFDNRPIIALLPGSRKQEVRKMLGRMLDVAEHFADYQFVVAGAQSLPESFYRNLIRKHNVILVMNRTYSLLQVAHAALVTSGTATLETAMFNVPQVVGYRGSFLSYLIAKQLVKVKYISLVNLIADKPVVPELIQHEYNPQRIEKELKRLLGDSAARQKMLQDYVELREKLGGAGASDRTAERMIALLHDRNNLEI